MYVPPPWGVAATGVLFVPAVVASRFTDGYSLALLVPTGAYVAYVGVLYLVDRAAWLDHAEWQRGQSRKKLLALNLARDEPTVDAWRILSGQLAVVFGLAAMVLGVLGAFGSFA